MIKLVAFDWNGTLLSDTITTLNSSNKIFKLYGIKPISLKAFRETFAIPITDFYKHWTKKEIDFIELSKKYHTIYEKAALKKVYNNEAREKTSKDSPKSFGGKKGKSRGTNIKESSDNLEDYLDS
jgi:phosphoglycolate phosphatase-like HAD superfamily hydrolase